MTSQQPGNDPEELSPKEKTKRVKYIGIAVALFFLICLIIMLVNIKPNPMELPAQQNNQQQEQ
ncbi:hypothetical protein GCM10023206_14230 [Acinetobacter puyangensis]|uniref:Uncharacterized protein n=1 Tax=Acinetobacter puyangensis TaxID=1096779 RepID=A0A240E7Z3_9GAMM|nr:hypothetical protein [Acinetobacter puyangensis]SNX44857.1 hypothetical protein SAMN05421731_104216 [Acinetobacter puyangensis]